MELPLTEIAQVDPQSEEWFASYAESSDQSSNQRRRIRQRRGRDPVRQRRHRLQRLNTVMMLASAVFVAAMTGCFYAVLIR